MSAVFCHVDVCFVFFRSCPGQERRVPDYSVWPEGGREAASARPGQARPPCCHRDLPSSNLMLPLLCCRDDDELASRQRALSGERTTHYVELLMLLALHPRNHTERSSVSLRPAQPHVSFLLATPRLLSLFLSRSSGAD